MRRLLTLFLFTVLISFSGSSEEKSVDAVLNEVHKEIDALKREYPNQALIWHLEGNTYYRTRKYESAINSFKESLDLDPSNSSAAEMIAFLYSRLDDHENAVDWYKRTLTLDPENEKQYYRLGLSLLKLDRRVEATEAFRKEVELFPDNEFAHYHLALQLFEGNEIEGALEHIHKAAHLNENFPEPYYLLARIQRAQGNEEEAQQSLKTFQDRKQQEQNVLEQEDNQIDRNVSVDTVLFLTHFDIALIYNANKKFNKAVEHLKEAIRLEPHTEIARYELARIYQDMGQIQQSVNVLRELVTLKPEEPVYHTFLGTNLAELKNFPEARKSLENALALNPDELQAQENLARILILTKSDLNKAISLLLKALNQEPTAVNYDWLARAYYLTGDIQSSEFALQMAVDTEPMNPVYKQRLEALKAKMAGK